MKLSKEQMIQVNNVLVLAYQDGQEMALNKLLELNEGLIGNMINQFQNIKYLEEAEKESLCYLAFYKAAQSYKQGQGRIFSSYASQLMKQEILQKMKEFKYKDRLELHQNTASLSTKVSENNGDLSELGDILKSMGDTDNYFDYEYVNVQPAIDFAIVKVREDLRPYILPVLIGDMRPKDVIEDTGVCGKLLNFYLRKFKDSFKAYTLEHNTI